MTNQEILLPEIGYGTYHDVKRTFSKEYNEDVYCNILEAIDTGYRLLDSASGYFNEKEVGNAVKDSKITRSEIIITTKMRISEQGYDNTLRAFENSLERLGVSYIDLYLLHWPVREYYLDTYRAMERLYEEGLIKAIGVSNFQVHHLEKLFQHCNIFPMVNQIEIHPYLTQENLVAYCQSKQILIEAWGPLGRGVIEKEPVLEKIAVKYNRTAEQIMLRWLIQRGIIPIPKAGSSKHRKENLDTLNFAIEIDDMKDISSCNKNMRNEVVYPRILFGDYNDY